MAWNIQQMQISNSDVIMTLILSPLSFHYILNNINWSKYVFSPHASETLHILQYVVQDTSVFGLQENKFHVFSVRF